MANIVRTYLSLKPLPVVCLATLWLTVGSIAAHAEIYRVVDKDGKVSYTDQPPKNGDAENIQHQVEEAVQRNSAQSLETQRENDPDWVKKAREEREKQKVEQEKQQDDYATRRSAWKEALKQAKQNLKAAKLAQEQGKEAIEGDFIGKAGGGARPSEQYFNRQKMLAENVASAEKALKQVRKEKPEK